MLEAMFSRGAGGSAKAIGAVACVAGLIFFAQAASAYLCKYTILIPPNSNECWGCINQDVEESYADCRACCISFGNPVGGPGYNNCRLANGC